MLNILKYFVMFYFNQTGYNIKNCQKNNEMECINIT